MKRFVVYDVAVARIVGIKDVARHADVSVGTVSNVINRPDLVAPETRDRVLAVIEQLGYVRSEAARHLRAGRSRFLAMLVLDMANPFFVQVASGAERAARDAGLRVLLCDSANDPVQEADYLSLFAEQRVRGVLLTRPAPVLAWRFCVGRRSRSCWSTGWPPVLTAARCRSTTWRAGASPLGIWRRLGTRRSVMSADR